MTDPEGTPGPSDTQRSRSEARLRSILENSSDWIWEMGLDGRHSYSNRRVEEILGYTAEEFAQLDFLQRLHPDDLREVEERLPRLVAEGRGWTRWIVRARRKDGSWCHLESSASPLFDASGQVVGFQGVDRDVTERHAAEERLRQAQKMEAVGQLAGGVAHDFNNLLTVILGETEMLRQALEAGGAPPDQVERAEAIERAATRGAGLTRQLLAFSRGGGEGRGPTDLTATLGELESMLRRLIGEHIALEVVRGREALWLPVGKSPLEQLVVNLVINARDAVREGGTIRLETERLGERVRLSVQDDGRGMDEATRARVFEPFFTTKRPGEGTGLGLATVYATVTQAGGTIGVESRPGQGSVFRVELPRVDPAEGAAESAAAGRAAGRSGAHILVCEDDPHVRQVTRGILEQAGFRVEAATGADEAVALAQGPSPFDLLVTDVVMPGRNGIELARLLTARDPRLRVLFVSGHPQEALRDHALDEEDLALLYKPFRPRDLLERVTELLG